MRNVKLEDVLPGKGPFGYWNAKLSQDDADRIRQLHSQGASLNKLAKAYGVTWKTIQSVILGKTWTRRGVD
jgi:hypothetical protein